MTNPAEDARRELGLPTSAARPRTADIHQSTEGYVSPPPPSAYGSRMGLSDIAAGSVDKSHVAVDGLGSLTTWSWVATVLAVAVGVGHRRLLSVVGQPSGFPSGLTFRELTLLNAAVWAPWAAAGVAVVLIGLACATRGFTRANRRQIVAITAADVAASVLAIPLALAVATYVAVFLLIIVLVALALGLLVAVLLV